MNNLRADALLLLLITSMFGTPSVQASSTVERRVVGNGGGLSTGGGLMLVGTLGQASIGTSAGSAQNQCAGFWCSVVGTSVSVENPGMPMELAFATPAPNPAGGAVRLAIALPGPMHVRLMVFDAGGRRIKMLTNQMLGEGPHIWTWDLRSEAGERVLPGIYFTRLQVNGRAAQTRRIVVIR